MESTGNIHTKPFRIALISDGLFPMIIGGMQKHSVRLAASLADAGTEVMLFHPHESSSLQNVFTSQQLSKITGVYVPWPRVLKIPGHYLLRNYLYSRTVHRILKEKGNNIDVIYVQGLSGWKTILKGIGNIPVVLNMHGMEMFQITKGFRNRLNSLLLRFPAARLIKKADAVVSLGGKLSMIIKEIAPKQRIIELPVGIDDQWLQPDKSSEHSAERKVLFVGRYEWRKGLDVFNAVIPELLEIYKTNLSFEFIGAIPDDKRLKNEKVHYHGPLYNEEKIQEIYKSAFVLVCPSYSEGMPTVILEAMSAGLPVIASDVGAVSNLVSDENGRLVNPGNPQELKAALDYMLTIAPALLDKLGKTSAKKAETFRWSAVAQKTISDLKRLRYQTSTMER